MSELTRRSFLKASMVAGGAAAAGLGMPSFLTAQSKEPIKIGVLHSLSGTMAISEVSLREAPPASARGRPRSRP